MLVKSEECSQQGCVQFRVESTLTHSTQFSFELTFELIFECATLWMPIHWAEWGFIGLVRTIPFNSHSRIDSLLSKSSHGWECECARMAFELDTTLMQSLFTSYPLTNYQSFQSLHEPGMGIPISCYAPKIASACGQSDNSTLLFPYIIPYGLTNVTWNCTSGRLQPLNSW